MTIEPSEHTLDRFREDLTWLRSQVMDRAKGLSPEKTKDFRLTAISEMFKVWDLGKDQGRLDELTVPRMKFDAENHTFQVTFRTQKIQADIEIKVHVKREHGFWGVFEQ